MSQTLQSVTLETIGHTRKAAEHALRAYRSGGQRVVRAVDARVSRGLEGRAARLAPALSAALDKARAGLADAALRSLEAVAAGTHKAIELGSQGAAQQVRKAAALARGVHNPYLFNGLTAAARLGLPGVRVVRDLTERMADGAGAVSKKVAADGAGKPARARRAATRAAQAAAQPVRRARAAAKPAAGEAFEAVLAEMTQRGRRTRAAAKPAARKGGAAKATKADAAQA